MSLGRTQGHGHAHARGRTQGHAHTHAHGDAPDFRRRSTRRLAGALALIVGFMSVQLVAGLAARSLTLLADAGHMLTDAFAIGVALLAMRLATRRPSRGRTYGYQRLEIVAALANAASLCVIAVWIGVEAVQRFGDVPDVRGGVVLSVGAVGFLVNLGAAALLRESAKHSVNVEGAFQHVVADLLGSIGVVVSGLLVWAFGWNMADPIVSLVISVIIFAGAWRLLSKSVHVLLQGAPDHIDRDRLRDAFLRVAGVNAVHDLHVWTLAPGYDALTAHVVVDKERSDGSDAILNRLRAIAYEQFDVRHVTLQLESEAEQCREDHPA